MTENRLTSRLQSYWDLMRKDASLPNYSQFSKSTINDMWENCAVFTVLPATTGETSSLSLLDVGDHLKSIFGNDMLGRPFRAQKRGDGTRIMHRVDEVIRSKTVLLDEGQYVNNNKIVKYRSCLLPFANNDERVTHVLVGLNWREF